MACSWIAEPKWKLTPDYSGMESNADTLIPDRMTSTESPKYNFAFTVQFFYSDSLNRLPTDNGQGIKENSFAVTKVSRPQPTFNYQKVNFYNFRTNVATSVDYGQVNIAFYDDPKNRAFNIFVEYLKKMSPIANVYHQGANDLDRYGQNNALSNNVFHSASVGDLGTRRHGLIRRLRVNHFYKLKGEEHIIHYDYLNPKIITASLSDLDMTTNGVTMVDMTFNYDSVYISNS